MEFEFFIKIVFIIIISTTENKDSGGFQMVSLAKLSKVTEDGVEFKSPHDESMMLLTPEKSMEIQNAIGKFQDEKKIIFKKIALTF